MLQLPHDRHLGLAAIESHPRQSSMYFLSNPIFRPLRPVANPPFLIQLCNKCGLLERAHSRPQPEQFPHQRGPAVNVNQFKQYRNTPPLPFQQQPLLRLPSMTTDMLPTHQDLHTSLYTLESMDARPSDVQQQNRSGGGMTEIGALLDDGVEAQTQAAGSPKQSSHQVLYGIKRAGSPLEQPPQAHSPSAEV